MKVLMAIDMELATKLIGCSVALAEKIPDMVSTADAAAMQDAVINHTYPTDQADEIIIELWKHARKRSGTRLS